MTLTLERQEIEAILSWLSERPYREVFPIIGKIVQQTNEQLAQKPIETGQEARPHLVQ